MDLGTVAGWLATLLVVLSALGAVVSLVTGPLVGEFAVATVVVVALTAVAVVAAARLGARSRAWLTNGGYW
ncbi:MAG: hypothetical protein V5A85_07925 [Haloarculaceae archaeon]|jgi:hypothetical protein